MTCGDKHVLSEASRLSRREVEGGGEVVAEGTPEQVAKEPRSYTGAYLKPLLENAVPAEVPTAIGRKKRGSSASVREREAAE